MKYLFGNWKMYLSNGDSLALAQDLHDVSAEGVTLAVFPNTLSFREVCQALSDSDISCGAQNVSWTPQGAYTGATSAHLFADSGATYALVGHSERRHVFGEGNEVIRKRLDACIAEGLTPVLCIGETAEDREQNKAEYRIKKQLMKALEGLESAPKQLFVAYEPVWAIGTGDACDPEEAVRMIELIKAEITQYIDTEVAVLYGGSVNSENMVSYVSHEAVDGVLVGRASTDAQSYRDMIDACKHI